MKNVFSIILTLLLSSVMYAQIDTSKITAHPRLLLLKGEESRILAEIKKDTTWEKVHNSIITESEAMLTLQPVERSLIGRRLLQVSRESLRRIFFLSYSWRLTHQKKFLKRCEEELLTVSKFQDWNPSHFLDIAEMTMAVSIGYDWLYNDLSVKSRETISKAIIEKGLTPSLDAQYNGWLRGSNNWNQVCNAGITFGALAVYENQPVKSVELLERAIKSIKIPMKEYAPDGNYKEGYSYWGYGTSFNVFFINALEKIFGTDFQLNSQPGFMQTAFFYENLIGPSGQPFSYSDCGGIEGLQPAMFWFADKLKDPSLLYIEKTYLQTSTFNVKTNRLLPAAMLWANGVSVKDIKEPAKKVWDGKGGNEITMMRTDWRNGQGIYVGFKGGTPSVSHGHMDAGSFVLDATGVRWSTDLGMQQYNSLESAGLDIWNMTQSSQRWDVFRYNNYSHSTLTINNGLQSVNGDATIIKTLADPLNSNTVMDLSSIYKKQVQKAMRGIAIINKQYVIVRDEVETGDSACTIRWSMVTPATVASINGNQARLTSKGQKLTLFVNGLPDVTFKTYRTDPPHSYDALNLGTIIIGFEITVPAHTKQMFDVIMVPGEENVAVQKSSLKPLAEW
ncbi:MAG: heparinase II/III family protein [Chitinophagaceae bacterium]